MNLEQEVADLRRQLAMAYRVSNSAMRSAESDVADLKAQLEKARDAVNTLDCLIEDIEALRTFDDSPQIVGFLRDAEKARDELKAALAPEQPEGPEQQMMVCPRCKGEGRYESNEADYSRPRKCELCWGKGCVPVKEGKV